MENKWRVRATRKTHVGKTQDIWISSATKPLGTAYTEDIFNAYIFTSKEKAEKAGEFFRQNLLQGTVFPPRSVTIQIEQVYISNKLGINHT